MRPTLLNFRHPAERTAEFRNINFTYTGNNLDFLHPSSTKNAKAQKSRSNSPEAKKANKNFGTSFNREKRFYNEERYYCKLSGQSVCVGPGSYNDQKNY